MNKITAILLALVMLVGGFVGGFVVGTKDVDEYSPYEVIYANFDKMSPQEKVDYYKSVLKAETSPSQVKYLMEQILDEPSIDNDVKNNVFAFYLNHVQYYMSTYSNFVSLYSSIMTNNMSTINYEEASASEKINDQVLKTIIEEIYESDMMIKMPDSTSGDPYVIVDYDKLEESYGSMYNKATKNYIIFKEIVQNGELSNADGSYNMEKVRDYILMANEYILAYENYPLISDIIYSYILGAKMYLGIYSFEAEFIPDADTIEDYKMFIEENPDTPIAPIVKAIIEKAENGEKITATDASNWNKEIDALLG